ncbi:integrase core domain-containing protein [Synechococcus sp. CBW1107]|uniref:integrase core domain-containing protein n=1 Tax=Synechococcus sp. CBW1107 TaxID=2789857 RepID=UPI002AD43D6A|nr:integrase core domain-containing protein [Synechococcus sp. CBW1107]CAK6690209.1 hypothetical protein ICNINCKA_00762 [Synechococcus sp. CBW1107]
MALSSGRKPEIFHSDQGCQFTSSEFVARLQGEKIKISWSGRKRCYDNILVERLWRTIKYEEVYTRAYSDGWEAEISLARFPWRYCHVRLHSELGGRTPHVVYTQTDPLSSRQGLTMSGPRLSNKKLTLQIPISSQCYATALTRSSSCSLHIMLFTQGR